MQNNELIRKIESANSIAILGHMNPDGDCIGSCLGLYNYLLDNYPEKEVVVLLQEIPKSFHFLRGADEICHVPTDRVFDLACSLDCGDTDRHSDFSPAFANARDTVCIDHHRSNKGFGNYFCCEPDASSACEVLYKHLDPDKVSRETAEALYLGIVHDTGVFKYPSTSKLTMEIAGALIEKGIDTQFIIDETFFKVTYKQNRMTGQALLNAKLHLDGKVISTHISREMFREFDAGKEETEGIVDKIRVTEGCEVAIFSYQIDEGLTKFSLRSIRVVDVSKIAVAFGGGGHIRAAGFQYKGAYEDAFAKILAMIKEQLS